MCVCGGGGGGGGVWGTEQNGPPAPTGLYIYIYNTLVIQIFS